MIQSFGNEFDLLDESPQLPAPPGEVVGESLDEEKGSKYRSGTGKIMMKCSCYEIMIRARELSRFMAFLTPIHLKHMHRPMIYVRHTAKFGNFIKPKVIWDSHDKAMEFIISGRNALDPETRRSVSEGTVFLCDTVIFDFSHADMFDSRERRRNSLQPWK